MRLRLTVRRHSLPETPIIWVVDTTTSPTIAQLLEQVNDAIPIEAGEWGFEDYAVEVKGNNGVNYECLHYQSVSRVMKEEDEVIIRPLLTQDLKVRRISGRIQISADGKHLVDGLAFGRPLLRRPADRPAVNIPPRKKRRITYQENEDLDGVFAELEDREDSDSGSDSKKQLVLHADFDDDSEKDDDDFAPGGEEDADEEQESEEDIEEENEDVNEGDEEDQHTPISQPQDDEAPESTADQLALADVPDQATRAKIRKLHSAFPISALAVCKYILIGTEGDMGEAYEALNRGFVPVKSKSAVTEISQEHGNILVPKTRSKAGKTSTKRPEDEESIEANVEESHDPLVDYYDQNGFPPGSIQSGKLTSFAPDVTKSSTSRPELRRSNSVASNKNARFAVSEDLTNGLTSTPFIDQESHEDDDESEESSEDSSDEEDTASSSDSDDSSEEEASQDAEASCTSSSESDSDNSSDPSSNDDAPEETSSKPAPIEVAKYFTAQTTFPEIVDQLTKITDTKAGQGKASTRSRNQRRRQNIAMTRWKAKGILPESTTIHEFIRMGDLNGFTSAEDGLAALERVRAAMISDDGSELSGQALAKSEEFELRRQELLASLSTGGIEVGHESSRQKSPDINLIVERSTAETTISQAVQSQPTVNPLVPVSKVQKNASVAKAIATSAQSEDMRPSTAPEASTTDTPILSPQQETASAESTPARPSRRTKVDLGAGRRLLFGALGIKTPKTKKDEENIRKDLMKYVRPLKAPEDPRDNAVNADEEVVNEDPEAWKAKIVYRAVECVQKDVVLSEPPFPFVQRWDPQQQNPWYQKGNRGGKRKQNQRDQPHYCNDDPRLSKKQKEGKGKFSYAEEQEYLDASYEPSFQDDSIFTDYDDPSQSTRLQSVDVEGEISQQLLNDANQEPDDLAPLPDDPASLPNLDDGQAKVGMTIAFKLLDCSATTKWQPQMTAYRTAIVIATPESGELHLTLAMRDRKQHKFDKETGERIYDKFDMPDADDEMEDGDGDGMLNLPFSELYEPKIVQEAPTNLSDATDMEHTSQNNGPSLINFVTLSHEDEAQEAQLSHVTETPLQSDAPEPDQQVEIAGKVTDAIAQDFVEQVAQEVNDTEEEFHEALQQPLVEDNVMDESANSASNNNIFEPTTPAVKAGAVTLTNIAPNTISDEDRRNISHMITDAGFRSSIPSSIAKDIRPSGMESPGDAAVFQKLMRDMTEIGGIPLYPPKFNSLGSISPVRKIGTSQVLTESQYERSASPVAIQSSWMTIDAEPERQSSPLKETNQLEPEQLDTSSWVTDPEDQPSSPPIRRQSKRNSMKQAPPKRVPVGKAQAMWEQLQPPNRRGSRGSTKSPADSGKTSPNLGSGFDDADEIDTNEIVQYPKLSVGSSFTSQITDHGRQPDFNFDDSIAFNANSPMAPEHEVDNPMQDAPKTDDDKADLPPRHMPTKDANDGKADGRLSENEPDIESKPPPQMSPISTRIEALMNSPAKNAPEPRQKSPSSSDEPFPTLEEVFSQRSVKPERTTPIPKVKPTKGDKEYKKAMAKVDEVSDDSNQSTPKASQQKRNQNSHSQSFESKIPESRSIKRRSSQPQVSQPQSQASQFIDLTLSSDVEPDADAAVDPDDSQPSRAFGRYDQDAEVDKDYKEQGGWAKKYSRTITGVGSKRKSGNGLKDSLQGSLTTQNRRKTTARF